jgi:predicted negative regulator of RcsB-dependent stress response/DNA-binding CsgD family transcriptional regulator
MDDPTHEYLVKDLLLYYLEIGYYLMGDYRTALIYGNNNLIPNIEKYDVLPYITNMNTVGIIYRNLNQLDSSNYYFMQILQMASQKKDSVWISLSNGNLAENFYLQKNYDAALPLLKSDADYAFSTSDFGPASNAYLLMTTIYLRKGNIENAEKYLKKGTESVYKYRFPNVIDKYRRFKLLYETLTQYYISKNNAQLAQLYLDSSKIITDSIVYIRTNMTSVKTEGIFNLQQGEIQKLKLNNDLIAAQKKQYIIGGLLIILILLGAFGFTQYRNKAKLKQASLKLEKEKVEVDLTAARAELENYIIKFTTLTQMDENDVSWKETTILTQEHWQKFQELFQNSYPDFTQRLQEKIPGLTETELRFFCLLKVKLNDTEMGNVLGVNKNTIQQTRSRLRKKLNLDGNVSLNDLVEEV